MKHKVGFVVIGGLICVTVLAATQSLILRDTGIQFPDGTIQATAAEKGLQIIDSQGQAIGPLLGLHNYGRMATYVRFGESQEAVFFNVGSDSFELVYSGFLVFSGVDCTGDIYIGDVPGYSDFFSQKYYAFASAGTLFQSEGNQTVTVEPQSWWTGFQSWTVGDISDYCSNTFSQPFEINYYPAVQLSDLSTLHLVPVFRLE